MTEFTGFNIQFEAVTLIVITTVITLVGFLLKSSFEDMKKALNDLQNKITEIEKKNINLIDSYEHLQLHYVELRKDVNHNRGSLDKVILTMTACEQCRKAIDKKNLIE